MEPLDNRINKRQKEMDTNHDNNLLQLLERKRIKYVAFMPDLKFTDRGGDSSREENTATGSNATPK